MKQEDTKQRILDKALELFSTCGYDSVSVGQIAEAVGIRAPSLYNHYPGKQAIFDAIVAVNTDPEAAIFNYCTYGIVGDMDEVCEAMLAKLGE